MAGSSRPRVGFRMGSVQEVTPATNAEETGLVIQAGVGIGPPIPTPAPLPPGMHFVLSELANPLARVLFPMNPTKVTVSDEAKVETFPSTRLGDVPFPRGRAAMRFSWEGILPGGARINYPFVKFWRPPIDFIWNLRVWQGFNTKLHLLVTETDIHDDVFISRLERTFEGGYGDIGYTIELSEFRVVFLSLYTPTAEELAAITAIGQGTGKEVPTAEEPASDAAPLPSDDPNATPADPPEKQPADRPADPAPATYTVKAGDSLVSIAKVQLGDSSKWKAIYELNKDVIGDDPDEIKEGQVLKLPGGEKPTAGEQTQPTTWVPPGSKESIPTQEGTRATGMNER